MTIKTSKASASARLAAFTALANGGSLEIRTGTAPATPETTATGTLLATLTLSATAFGTPDTTSGDAIATANAVTSANAVATGTAGYFRVLESDGTTCIEVGTCGTSGADLNLVTTSITSGQPVSITSWTITDPT